MSFYAKKNVLITGGSSGIGLAMACQIAKDGGRVFILGRNPSRLDQAKQKIEMQHSQKNICQTICCDVTDVSQLKKELSTEITSTLDVVIHSAGSGGAKEFDDTSVGEFKKK